jgi:predicted porin
MNKKVMAVAVAGLLAAPAAFAQSSNVQLYGRAVLGIDNYSADGARDQAAGGANCGAAGQPACTLTGNQADFKGRMRVFDNSSRVGLRGTEDLGNGLKAIFQIETGVNIDNGSNTGQGGQANVSSGFWASRDSFVGLDSNFGRLTFGRQSIYWANGVNAQFAANYINTEIPWTNGTGLGRVGAPTARTNNTAQYTSPTFAGINGTLSWSPGAGSPTVAGANQEAVQNNNTVDANGSVWGVTLRGTWGPFYVQGDWAQLKGNQDITLAGAPRLNVEAWKAGASWGYMPGARIGVIWAMVDRNYAVGLATGDKANTAGWTLNWEHTFGNFQVMAQYGQQGDLHDCDSVGQTISCSDSSAQGYMVGGRYFLSKRTWLFASWNLVNNKQNQFADYTGGAQTSVGAGSIPYGADPQIWALGIFHQF